MEDAAEDLAALARSILARNRYMTLATASAAGEPWASPVWFAAERHRELYWVSLPGARHSRNIAARPEVGIVVFDSSVAPGEGQAVYMAATAAPVEPDGLEAGLAVFSRRSAEQGIGEWGPERVTGDAPHRLFRAVVREHSALVPGWHPLHADRPGDFRVVVDL